MSHPHPLPHIELCPLHERNKDLQSKLKFELVYLLILKRLKSENSFECEWVLTLLLKAQGCGKFFFKMYLSWYYESLRPRYFGLVSEKKLGNKLASFKKPTRTVVWISANVNSWRRQWHPTPVLLPGKSHGWRSPMGCSPWGCEESETTERLHFHFSLSCIGEGNGNPLQCSCLENPRVGGAWWAAVSGVAQSRTQLKRLSSSSSKVNSKSKWNVPKTGIPTDSIVHKMVIQDTMNLTSIYHQSSLWALWILTVSVLVVPWWCFCKVKGIVSWKFCAFTLLHSLPHLSFSLSPSPNFLSIPLPLASSLSLHWW